jgi:hypothetical protein
MRYTAFSVTLALFIALVYSTSASANPDAPEIYEFSISPSVLDLSSGDGVIRIRVGARDADGLSHMLGWCQGEPHTESARFGLNPEIGVENMVEMWHQTMAWSGDENNLVVEIEPYTIYTALTIAGVHNCQVTVSDMLGNDRTAYTQYTVAKSSTPNLSAAPTNPSNSSDAAALTETPTPTQPSTSEPEEDSDRSIDTVPELQSGLSESGSVETAQYPTFLIISTAFATALILGAGFFLGRRFGPMGFKSMKQKK